MRYSSPAHASFDVQMMPSTLPSGPVTSYTRCRSRRIFFWPSPFIAPLDYSPSVPPLGSFPTVDNQSAPTTFAHLALLRNTDTRAVGHFFPPSGAREMVLYSKTGISHRDEEFFVMMILPPSALYNNDHVMSSDIQLFTLARRPCARSCPVSTKQALLRVCLSS